MTEPNTLADWVARYVAEASREERLDDFVGYVDSAILAELPELAADPVLVTELHASTRSQFQVFLSLLDREKQELLLPPQAVDLALSIARRQLDLGVLLKVYRIAAGSVWEFFTRVVDDIPEDGPDRADALVYLWSHGGTWINEAIEQLIGVYAAEREATLRGALARRAETIHALLRGERPDLDAASADLGYALRGTHTAVVLWSHEEASTDVLADLNRLASSLATALGAAVVSAPAGRAELWCWFGTRRAPEPQALRRAVVETTPDYVQVASGASASGVDGFVLSHREAVDAQRHVVALEAGERFTAYAEVEIACLISGNPDAAHALVRRELNELAGDARGNDRIRETLAAYLASGGSVDQTSTALMVHKNTVRYRLGQAEKLVGHPLSERRTELALALHAHDRFADPV